MSENSNGNSVDVVSEEGRAHWRAVARDKVRTGPRGRGYDLALVVLALLDRFDAAVSQIRTDVAGELWDRIAGHMERESALERALESVRANCSCNDGENPCATCERIGAVLEATP